MLKSPAIGAIQYGGVSLAPMAGMTDTAFRLICKAHGADYMTTEMVSAKALCYGDKKTPILAHIRPQEMPCAVQLFGSEPDIMAKASDILLELSEKNGTLPAAIDVNMGCPMPKIVKCGDGSALMKEPQKAERIVRAMTAVCGKIPVTVKLRLGWDRNSINVVELAKRLEASGAAALCIHARTRDELYSPGTHPEYIRAVKVAVGIPVIGNGDVFCAADALRMLTETGCDGVAVARGALGNPWIFEEIHARLRGEPYVPPSNAERLAVALQHFSLMTEEKGERVAVAESRAAIAYYTKGMEGSAQVRGQMNTAESAEQIIRILTDFMQKMPADGRNCL